jgi:hypothetical protein
MLGVRREGITAAAGRLQRAGLINYRRGHIAVLERAGLEARACECYAVVRKELNNLRADVRQRQDLTSWHRYAAAASRRTGAPRPGQSAH